MDALDPSIAGLSVSRETFAALQQLEALVRRWTPAINLVSKATLTHLWDRHIVDSAQVFSLCPPAAKTWVDVGSGGGFPGLVVAILARELRPDLHVTLVESDQRKATFLRQAAQSLGLKAAVRSERIESLPSLQADVLSARALAALSELLGIADLHLASDGVAIFPKGSRYMEELAAARSAWTFNLETQRSLSDPEAAILVIRNIHRHVG
ncbi:16S rRNA (guanine(527)-N(7))-methyltransferase RsmG [Tabrizicola aquatica]|uniref:16S rRNA (guanine(527)-N(7))-methyltransferase RsmG n=1 Tax=Tabrizicola aquatica TaxID=909926 RepID=UPI000CD22D91|nr:16S rRNA (guanine(527)-N(7))-methyltransferase RsmG [Tabrizicola aquatica]